MDNSALESVVFNDENLKEVGVSAFARCGLKSIALPSGLTNLNETVFAGCKDLVSVEFHDSLLSIETSCFQATSLTSIVFPENLTQIDVQAFALCTSSERAKRASCENENEERSVEYYGHGSALFA